jgi:PAS domain S-box-containing protein
MPLNPPGIAAERPMPASGPRTRLLLVDDDEANLLSLQATLEDLVDELVMVQSGEEALRYLLETDFAAILLDVKMPGMDGFETASMIRNRKKTQTTPILFLTAFQGADHLFRGYDLGAVDFLLKPISPDVLRSKVAVFVELARNATQLRHNAEVLAKAELRFRSLLEAAPDAILITNECGEIDLVNSRTEELFDRPREALRGRSVKMLVPDWTEMAQVHSIELTGIRRDGSEFPCELTCSPLQTEEGLLITTVVRDITERRRSDENIRRLNTELERRVASRTLELTRSNEALRQFAWAASHDLQEPLRVVVAYAQLLQRRGDNLDAQSRDFLNTIVNGALRMESLLSSLRDYVFASDAGSEQTEIVDAGELLEKVLDGLDSSLRSCGATVECGPMPVVRTVPVLLSQIFQNLIGNAMKYRSDKPLRILISAERQARDWLFSVADNGIGIGREHHGLIFGVFKRLHTQKVPGTGIGLPICKVAVERLGGQIWVESEPDQGAVFKFTLPATDT